MNPAAQSGTVARPLVYSVRHRLRPVRNVGAHPGSVAMRCCAAGQAVGRHAGTNPLGHWEPRKVNVLNEAILRRLGSSAFDPSLHLREEDAIEPEDKAASLNEIRAYLGTLLAAPLVVLKDPRFTLMSDLWFEAARQAGFDFVTVISVRHPQEVIESIVPPVRSGASPELSSALWLKYNPACREGGPRHAARVRPLRQPSRRLAPGNEADLCGTRHRSHQPGRGCNRGVPQDG